MIITLMLLLCRQVQRHQRDIKVDQVAVAYNILSKLAFLLT
jgi:hypothetical protein